MAHPSVILLAAIVAVTVLAALLRDGIMSDVAATLTIVLERAVRSNAQRFLPPNHADELISWFEGDLEELRERNGSGIGLALLFLTYTGPYYTWRLRRDNGARRK